MSNGLDPDQNRKNAGPNLGPSCLQSISADNTSRQRVLTLCILETPKRVLLQTVKTQMKCSIMLHFIRVFVVGFVALRPKSTAMVIVGRSVHLTTLFPGQA